MVYQNDNFLITVKRSKKRVLIHMEVLTGEHNTDFFAGVVDFLTQHAPEVLQTTCHNPNHLPFKKEVVRTEMGHLFEHILISCLCDEDCKNGALESHYSAETTWDWRINPKGSFDIVINQSPKTSIFKAAFERTVELTNMLFATERAAAVIPAAA